MAGWEVERAEEGTAKLETLLGQGWEPFGATVVSREEARDRGTEGPPVVVHLQVVLYHLRRPVG